MFGQRFGTIILLLILCSCGSATERKISYLEMAKALIQEKDIPKARVALRNALKIDPKDPLALLLMDQVSEKVGHGPRNFSLNGTMVNLDLAHRKTVGPTISTKRETLWNLFQLSLSKQQWQQAADLIIRLNNTGASGDQVNLAIGLLAASHQRWDQTLQALSLTQHTNMNALPPLAALIKVYLEIEQPEQARSYLERILAQHPNHGFASGLLGAVLWELKDKRAALSAFERQTQTNPLWVEPWKDWASLQWLEGKRVIAFEILKNAVAQNPNSLVLLNTLASYYQADGQIDLAIEQYETVIRYNAGDLMAANNLAYLLADKMGDSKSLKKALSLTQHFEDNTQNPFLLDTLAWTYYKLHFYQEATRVLKKALAITPDHALINYHFGIIKFEMGDQVAAKKHLEKAMHVLWELDKVEDARKLLTKIEL